MRAKPKGIFCHKVSSWANTNNRGKVKTKTPRKILEITKIDFFDQRSTYTPASEPKSTAGIVKAIIIGDTHWEIGWLGN